MEDPDNTEAKMCSALLEQTHLARALEVLAELAVNPTRETNKGLLSTYHNLLTVHHDFPTLTGLYAAAPRAAERERELIITELDQVVKLVHDLASENGRACRFKMYEDIREILTDRAKSHLKVSDGAHSARLTAAHMGCRSLDLQADNQALRKKSQRHGLHHSRLRKILRRRLQRYPPAGRRIMRHAKFQCPA